MKTSLQPGFVMPKAVMALCVLGACATSAFAQQYPPQQPKPRVGTRFLNFVKDLVWGEEPDNRYQGYAPPPNSAPTHGYGAQGGRRYNLDSPPPVADYDGAASQQPPQYQVPPPSSRPPGPPPHSQAQTQNQNHLSQPQPYQQEARDMPYTTPRQEAEKTPEPARAQRREAVQEQPPAPVKQKPHAEEHKKVEESPPPSQPQSKGGLFSRKSEQPKKEVEESLPESKPQKTTNPKTVTETPRNNPPAETPKEKETVVASNNAAKDKGADSPAPASTGSTLTGTRTTKAGLVKSPYPPYNELDVTGLPTGSLAMDPTTGKVFRVP